MFKQGESGNPAGRPAGHSPTITVHGWSAKYNRVIAEQLTVALNKQNRWNDEFIYYPEQR